MSSALRAAWILAQRARNQRREENRWCLSTHGVRDPRLPLSPRPLQGHILAPNQASEQTDTPVPARGDPAAGAGFASHSVRPLAQRCPRNPTSFATVSAADETSGESGERTEKSGNGDFRAEARKVLETAPRTTRQKFGGVRGTNGCSWKLLRRRRTASSSRRPF